MVELTVAMLDMGESSKFNAGAGSNSRGTQTLRGLK
jgi:hypothetical protein